MGNFQGQVAIVTGGATGIGGATARVLARRGAKVLIADIDEETAATNVQSILDANGTAVSIRVDVSKADDSQRMVREAVDRWGRIDILVQNAFGVVTMPAGFQGRRGKTLKRMRGSTEYRCWQRPSTSAPSTPCRSCARAEAAPSSTSPRSTVSSRLPAG